MIMKSENVSKTIVKCKYNNKIMFYGCLSTTHTIFLYSCLQMMLHMFDNNVKLSWFVDPGLTEWTVIFITT